MVLHRDIRITKYYCAVLCAAGRWSTRLHPPSRPLLCTVPRARSQGPSWRRVACTTAGHGSSGSVVSLVCCPVRSATGDYGARQPASPYRQPAQPSSAMGIARRLRRAPGWRVDDADDPGGGSTRHGRAQQRATPSAADGAAPPPPPPRGARFTWASATSRRPSTAGRSYGWARGVRGPPVIESEFTTVLVPPDAARFDPYGNVVLSV